MDELHPDQIRLGPELHRRPRTGDPRPDQRRRAGARQEDPCGRKPREGRHAPVEVSTKTNDFSKQQNKAVTRLTAFSFSERAENG